MTLHQVISGRAVLAVEAHGDGPPTVFLHAAVADLRMWRPLRETGLLGVRAIAYDRRGFGETIAPPEPHDAVADLWAVADALAPGDRVHLVGCSQGGRIALDAALQAPQRVASLSLIAPAVSGAPAGEPPPTAAAKMEKIEAAETAGALDQVNALEAELWLDGVLAEPGRVGGPLRDLFLDMNGRALGAGDVGPEAATGSAYDRLGEVQAPTLVIWGDLDFPHIQARCRHLVEAIPGARGKVIDGAAHLPVLESPLRVGRLVAEFLRRVDDGSSTAR